MLESILTEFFVDDEKEAERLFSPDRPIGTYGSRVSLAYCLGLIGKTVRDDLRLVGKIRNRFAHDLNVTFGDDPIRSWCLSLKWHQVSMFMPAPSDATPSDVFQVGVNQLVAHLSGIISIARMGKCQLRKEF
jgi:DNA-binding MltR family transcriptional regulator